MNYFTLFDLPETFDINVAQLSSRYQELQRLYHPDKFASQPEADRLNALQLAANINQGYQALRKPLPRAEYLLSLHGFDINNEQHTMHDTAFLMQQLTLREELEQIEQRKDIGQLTAWCSGLTEHSQRLEHKMREALSQQQWSDAADAVRKLRFFSKLSQQAEALEEQWLDF